MSCLTDGDALENKIRDFRVDVIGSGKHFIFAWLQFLETKITIRPHAGVVERNLLSHPTDIDPMFASPALTAPTAVVVI